MMYSMKTYGGVEESSIYSQSVAPAGERLNSGIFLVTSGYTIYKATQSSSVAANWASPSITAHKQMLTAAYVTSSIYVTADVTSQALELGNILKTKRKLLYLKTQFVPRSKHFSSRL